MRRMLVAVLVAAVPVWAAAEEKGKDKAAVLYPLGKGTKWQYDVTVGGNKLEATAEVVESETKDGKTDAKLENNVGGQTIKEEVSSDAKAVYRKSFQGMALDKPLPIIKYPPKAGTTWQETVKAGGMELDASFKMKEAEEVTVAAGKYKAVPVEMTVKVADQTITATNWYAEGVGLVKQTVTIGGMTINLELKKFTAGK